MNSVHAENALDSILIPGQVCLFSEIFPGDFSELQRFTKIKVTFVSNYHFPS